MVDPHRLRVELGVILVADGVTHASAQVLENRIGIIDRLSDI
jgi:hypothetical protein